MGRYELIRLLGKGGMGEVWLAYDPICERRVALKRMRSELKDIPKLVQGFLKEARISAMLTHPGIISIYEIGPDYYVMPYVEGSTLKTKIYQEQLPLPSLLSIFFSLCQTIAYAHSRGILHRDLKPENIVVGPFGEVILIDWGLADWILEPKQDGEEQVKPDRVIGTVAYMAPERTQGQGASVQTDLYALGIILYQILTLSPPFERPSLKEFIKHPRPWHVEPIDPIERAPYRGISPFLSKIVLHMLAIHPKDRYQTVTEVMEDLRQHLEGTSLWIESARLSIHEKQDWEFQELLLLSHHVALTGTVERSRWVNAMLSKEGFPDPLQIETSVYIEEGGEGIGFLVNVPDPALRTSPFQGYCIWIHATPPASLHVLCNTIEVLTLPDLPFKQGVWHRIILEKIGPRIRLLIDGEECLRYMSYLPLAGSRIGLISQDGHFKLTDCHIKSGGRQLNISCLSVPDSLLAYQHYKEAFSEYRRISLCFHGYAEGREAQFRMGMTLLEEAKHRGEQGYCKLHTEALEEFSKLHGSASAPYEYLGKALVYQALNDSVEEIKCLELGLRRYNDHPLVPVLKDHIHYRTQEAAQTDRVSVYKLLLIHLQLISDSLQRDTLQQIFTHVLDHAEVLSFFESPLSPSFKDPIDQARFATYLAFWIAAPYTLIEIFERYATIDTVLKHDILFCLIELGSFELTQTLLSKASNRCLEIAIVAEQDTARSAWEIFKREIPISEELSTLRTLFFLIQSSIIEQDSKLTHEMCAAVLPLPLEPDQRILLDSYRIWAFLQENQTQQAGAIFDTYPIEMLNQETSWLHPLFGCYLVATEGEEIANVYLCGVTEVPYPRSYALLGHEISYGISHSAHWHRSSFLWERRQLYRVLSLYYHLLGKPDQAYEAELAANREYARP